MRPASTALRMQRDKNEGQAQLFGAFGAGASASAQGTPLRALPLPEATPWSETEQLTFEKETLGLYWSGHPVDRYASVLKEFGARATGELAERPVNGASSTPGPLCAAE